MLAAIAQCACTCSHCHERPLCLSMGNSTINDGTLDACTITNYNIPGQADGSSLFSVGNSVYANWRAATYRHTTSRITSGAVDSSAQKQAAQESHHDRGGRQPRQSSTAGATA